MSIGFPMPYTPMNTSTDMMNKTNTAWMLRRMTKTSMAATILPGVAVQTLAPEEVTGNARETDQARAAGRSREREGASSARRRRLPDASHATPVVHRDGIEIGPAARFH